MFSRVMREGLSTGPGAKRPGSGLSGPIFSGPDDCAISVNSLQDTVTKQILRAAPEHFDASGVCSDGTEIEHSPKKSASERMDCSVKLRSRKPIFARQSAPQKPLKAFGKRISKALQAAPL